MMRSLHELTKDEIIQLTQANMISLMRFWTSCSDVIHAVRNDTCFRVWSSLKHPLFNSLLKTTIDDGKHDFVQTIIYEYRKANLPFLWRVWDHDTPLGLGEQLIDYGGQQIHSTALMAIDLPSFHPLSDPYSNLEIRTVRKEKEAIDFAICSGLAFSIPGAFIKPIANIAAKQDKNCVNFVGYLHEVPVSTASIFYNEGTAGIYNIGTIPKFQRKGIGLEMMTTLLLIGKLDGYQTAILHSTPEGIRLYEKLGFLKYGEMKQYLFS